MSDEVSARITEIIAEQALLDPADIKPDTSLEDLGLDSLGMVEVVFAIEECFDISVPFNANEPTHSDFDISKISHIVEGVKRLIAEKG